MKGFGSHPSHIKLHVQNSQTRCYFTTGSRFRLPLLERTAPSRKTILNRFASAQSVRSRVRISPLLFFITCSRVIPRALIFQIPIAAGSRFRLPLLERTAPSRKTILNRFASAQSVRSRVRISPLLFFIACSRVIPRALIFLLNNTM